MQSKSGLFAQSFLAAIEPAESTFASLIYRVGLRGMLTFLGYIDSSSGNESLVCKSVAPSYVKSS
jgi:hypothetical protein